MSIQIEPEKCNGCGKCSRSCPYLALEIHEKKARWLEDRCTLCGACLESCKFGALSGRMPVKDVPDFPDYKDVWVLVEQTDGMVHRSAFELLGCASLLAKDLGQRVAALVLGSDLNGVSEALFHHAADECHLVDNASLKHYRTCTYTHAAAEVIQKAKPAVLLIAATHQGRDLAPRLARRLKVGLTADCTRLSIDPHEKILLQTRPAFGGNIMATIVSRFSRPQTATVRPGIMNALEADISRRGKIVRHEINMAECIDFTRILECTMRSDKSAGLHSANIIVAGGRPICSEKGIKILRDFAHAVGGQVACTRVVVEEGYMSQEHQVGQTGQSVRPELYFACGISGAVQHRAGMENSRYIVAINKSADAPIFEIADFAVVGDLYEILPALTGMLKSGGVF